MSGRRIRGLVIPAQVVSGVHFPRTVLTEALRLVPALLCICISLASCGARMPQLLVFLTLVCKRDKSAYRAHLYLARCRHARTPSPVDPSSPQVSHCLFHLSTNPLAASGQIGIVTEFIGIIKRWENPSHNSSMSENIKQFAARRSPWACGWFVAGTCLSSSDRRGKLMPPLLP